MCFSRSHSGGGGGGGNSAGQSSRSPRATNQTPQPTNEYDESARRVYWDGVNYLLSDGQGGWLEYTGPRTTWDQAVNNSSALHHGTTSSGPANTNQRNPNDDGIGRSSRDGSHRRNEQSQDCANTGVGGRCDAHDGGNQAGSGDDDDDGYSDTPSQYEDNNRGNRGSSNSRGAGSYAQGRDQPQYGESPARAGSNRDNGAEGDDGYNEEDSDDSESFQNGRRRRRQG